ncbi:MAG: hypothetical protein WD689_10820 [Gaiellaceae bacterium]
MARTTRQRSSSAAFRARLGPRFGLEATFLIAVAVVLGLLEVSWPAIVAAMAISWLAIAIVEVALARAGKAPPALALPSTSPRTVTVLPPGEFPAPPPPPVLESVPAPVEAERPARSPAPVPAAAAETGPPPPTQLRPRGGREWNIWELERIARERAGANPDRDEERTFLLMSLREFARPDGHLPPDFDSLVREAFGDLLQSGR